MVSFFFFICISRDARTHEVSSSTVQGERRGKMLAFFHDRTAAGDAVGVHLATSIPF